jgi:hypothetical protein
MSGVACLCGDEGAPHWIAAYPGVLVLGSSTVAKHAVIFADEASLSFYVASLDPSDVFVREGGLSTSDWVAVYPGVWCVVCGVWCVVISMAIPLCVYPD